MSEILRADSEAQFLKDYDASQFERPSSSVDVVIFTFFNDDLHILILKRAEHPFKNRWSLVGGYVDLKKDQTLEQTARRKLEEKTGVKTPYLEQFETVGNSKRDPRGWSITTIYFALLPFSEIHLKPGAGAADVRWAKVVQRELEYSLAFDHSKIVHHCLERLASKVLYTSLPVHLMQDAFTLGELQKVYEVILGRSLDHKAFRRRILSAELLEETGEERPGVTRPAKLYCLKKTLHTHYFSRNLESGE